jgi:hypothetical protein
MDDVKVNSDPSDAIIKVDGNQMGKTPATIKLQRGKSHFFEISKSGYETYKMTTGNSITGWFWGNLLCGGIIGIVIDLATGNAFDVDPDNINVTLAKGTGMNEGFYYENFGSINIFNEDGSTLARINVIWE